ncbi:MULTISPECIES: hypothetical protein [Okeania]|uniref:Uncharacterized protein n=1 Tax=Okeania hirsuta TaxID=1458930 RepID=A0A3N6NXG8_9CYAN|nr:MULTISPECIES: hypothetical protein [Okeania]NET15198.1 hypothetical protein [Okeania sp. SIO1H6]NES76732.1 hypothetical protein [Okeania sp. SIO1H4]NES92241.1 hypothetical protein [Okeania sp. SIO2B9]NET20658.1 hypothetical protein [Okeania sp. SIO1H5]NET75651.1 hypothetical protein [Okeania sp. SIO1F9]
MILILITQESGVRSQESGGKKEEERGIEGESFLFSWRKTHVNVTRQVKVPFRTENAERGTEFYHTLTRT